MVKNTYLIKNSSRNQLRRCNVPPNHRPACSLNSQQCYHSRDGHDSPRNKEQAGLHIAKGTQNIQASTVGFIRPSTNQPSQHSWVYQAINKSAKPTQLGLSGYALISTMNLYQQPINQANTVGFIRPSTITHALI